MPVASTSASKVSRLMEKPMLQIAATVPIRARGIATVGINVARSEPMKSQIVATTIATAMERVMTTSRTEPRMKGRVVGNERDLHLVEAFVEVFHHAGHAVGDVDRVRPGLPHDAEAEDAPSALADVGLRILRPEVTPRPRRRSPRCRGWSGCGPHRR